MKILYLTREPPLDADTVATGLQVRAAGIRRALEDGGHHVEQTYPHRNLLYLEGAGKTANDPAAYATRGELARKLARGGFDAVLAGYYHPLLDHLPRRGPAAELPVAVDCIAPRLLEAMYEDDGILFQEVRQALRLLRRADHFLVGNARQRDLLLPLLILAGLDCRRRAPISVVPIATSGPPPRREPATAPLRIISAGVYWPWRDNGAFRAALAELAAADARIEFTDLGGGYPGAPQEGEATMPSLTRRERGTGTQQTGNTALGFADAGARPPETGSQQAGQTTLLSYRDMQARMSRCHIGMDLCYRNLEREFSHSFRSIDYLQLGLPLLANSFVPMADLIRRYDAGWLVDDPAALPPLLLRLAAAPGEVDAKVASARELAGGPLNYATACAPLLDWLAAPERLPKRSSWRLPQPPWPAALEKMGRLLRSFRP